MKVRERSKPNTRERYLWLRGNTWWFRYAVPTRFQHLEERKIIQRSLRTSDRRVASLLAATMRVDLNKKWEADGSATNIGAGGSIVEPDRECLMLAATELAYLRMPSRFADCWRTHNMRDPKTFDRIIAKLKTTRSKFIREREAGVRERWQEIADKQIESRGWKIERESDAYNAFTGMLVEAAVEALTSEIERLEGRSGYEPTSAVVRGGIKTKSEIVIDGNTIMDLYDTYANQRVSEGRKRAATVKQDKKVVERFVEFVGCKRSAASIRKDEVREWRNALSACPANFRKTNIYDGLTVREVAEKAKSLGAKGLSATTVSKYMSTISPFFAWCVSEGYASANPCDGLRYKPDKHSNRRPPFDDRQLRMIFSSPLFSGFDSDGSEHKRGKVRAKDWRYWIPLLCLFTGARIGEIAQLQLQDISEEHGVPIIHIRHNPTAGQQTKSRRSRIVPIHRQLIELGFVDYVKERSSQRSTTGSSQLFPELKPNERNEIGAKPSRFFRKYLIRIGLKKGSADGFGAHSFRHTIADKLRSAGYLDNQIAILLGHSLPTTTSGYGKLAQGTVTMLNDMVQSVEFPRVGASK